MHVKLQGQQLGLKLLKQRALIGVSFADVTVGQPQLMNALQRTISLRSRTLCSLCVCEVLAKTIN